ncbi:MAG: hypothetical protein ACU83N_05805 [Gammaproteobacteria bacterium]
MEKIKSDEKGELWGQLAHLEQQVSLLTSELQARAETIELLERSLSEKQRHISELEASLRVAHQSMLDLAWDNIQHYQQKLWAGVSRNLTDSKLAQLRNLLELIRSFPELTRHYAEVRIIEPSRHFVKVAINTVEAVRGDSTAYYQHAINTLVSKYRMGVKQLIEFFARFIEEAQHLFDQRVCWPIKNVWEDINETMKELPSEAGYLLQQKIVRPVWQYVGRLSVKFSKLQIEFMALVAKLRQVVQPLLSDWHRIVTGKIKSFKDTHSFGSHDQGMTGSYA